MSESSCYLTLLVRLASEKPSPSVINRENIQGSRCVPHSAHSVFHVLLSLRGAALLTSALCLSFSSAKFIETCTYRVGSRDWNEKYYNKEQKVKIK